MSSHLHCSIALPAAFRPTEILAFHRRDPQAGAEMVGERELHKGLVWDGAPAGLSLRFDDQRAVAELSVDGTQNAAADRRLAALLRRMLGLTQPVEDFERQFAAHPRLGPLIARQSGLRVAVAATPFEALSWAIIGQQISVSAAVAIRRRLIQAVGLRHSAGLLCYPGARELAQLSTAELRRAG
jgi:DNA-3-methyladenine glycosylase II